jgi:hypothetical protein
LQALLDNDRVGRFDLFNPTPVPFDNHRIVKTNGLGNRDLQSRNQAGKRGTCGHADDDAGNTGRSERWRRFAAHWERSSAPRRPLARPAITKLSGKPCSAKPLPANWQNST